MMSAIERVKNMRFIRCIFAAVATQIIKAQGQIQWF